jgi:hypothetical protein
MSFVLLNAAAHTTPRQTASDREEGDAAGLFHYCFFENGV